MSSLANKLLNVNLRDLQIYQSARRLTSGGTDWLNANESPFSNRYTLDDSRLNRYPACQPTEVIEAYARYTGVPPDKVMCTRGADEAIELLIRAYCTPGEDRILICPPTYGMYAISAAGCDVGVEQVNLQSDFSLDMPQISKQLGQVNLVFICSPNNPTGTVVARDQILEVLELFSDSALVVLDQAYVEFAPQSSWASELSRHANLVILRTLSKAFALAGLRCGFTLASSEIIQGLTKVVAPYPVPEPVAQIAAQALSATGIGRIRSQIDALQRQKTWLKQELGAVDSVSVVGDTSANFVLFRCEASGELMSFLQNQGILIRDQSRQPFLQDCLRATVGSEEQNQRLLTQIRAFYGDREQAS